MKYSNKESLSKIFSEFKVNNMSSYDNLYKEYYSTVYGIVFPIIKNKENAEDVTQEVFIKIYNINKDSLPEKGELSWLYTVSKNEALQFLRRKKQEINIDEIYEVKEEKNDIDEIIDINTYNKIISPLNEQEKQIVSLKILSNFTFKKIGQMLSMPTPTVQWKYYKAVGSLKISIGNLAAFIFTFIILIGRKVFKQNNNLLQNENVYEKETKKENEANNEEQKDIIEKSNNEEFVNNAASLDLNNKKGKSDYIENTIQSTIASTKTELENIDYFEPILIGFSSAFLIISIIFAIFFKNYQQKKNKKASK